MASEFDSSEMVFQDRAAAGRALASLLAAYRGRGDVVVLGVPRGGVLVAREVARVLHVPLDVLIAGEGPEAEQQRAAHAGSGRAQHLEGCTAIVVDDGLATGATMRRALTVLRAERPAWIVVALPVATPEAQELIGTAVDEFVCVSSPPGFTRIREHYREFGPVSDADVRAALAGPVRGV